MFCSWDRASLFSHGTARRTGSRLVPAEAGSAGQAGRDTGTLQRGVSRCSSISTATGPAIPSSRSRTRPSDRPHVLPEEVDVLIVGCGPAGLVLAAQLADFPDIRTAVIDRRTDPSSSARPMALPAAPSRCSRRSGSPSGWSTRGTGSTRSLLAAGPGRPDADHAHRADRGRRGGPVRVPHVIVNQARMHAYLLEVMERSPSRLAPHYDLHAPTSRSTRRRGEYPVTVTAAHGQPADREDLDGPGPLRRRLRRRAQHRPDRDRPRAGRRRDQPGLGCHGRPGGHRLPGHPLQVRDSLRQRGQHPDHPARGRVPGPVLHRARTTSATARSCENRSATPEKLIAVANRILHPYTRRRQGRRVVVGVRDRPAPLRQVRRRAGAGDGHPPAARVHRGRRLPHAQRQGRSGHERVHERHLEPGMEARRGPARDRAAGAAAHLLRGTPEGRQAAHRLRPRVRGDVQRPPGGGRRRRPEGASTRRSSSSTSSPRAASPRVSPRSTPRR